MLTLLGRLYRNPPDAVKEYISNALDEWQKADKAAPCVVDYLLAKDRIVITYNQAGMDASEFTAALRRVADSAKGELTTPQIGRLGIGIFAFNQVGRKCTFLSKKAKGSPTVKVVLASNSDEYDLDTAPHREALVDPGMRITIEQLSPGLFKTRGPFAPERLQAYFADRFDSYLRTGSLRLTIQADGKTLTVRPREVKLKPMGAAFSEVRLRRDPSKAIACTFWFDPTGKSTVAIRHMKVPIVEDVHAIQAYGLEESVFGGGYVKGYIDADFLEPQPARTSFVETDEDWINFLDALDTIRPSLEKEVDDLRKERERQQLTGLQRKAIQIASEILDAPEFQDLAPLGGLRLPRTTRPTGEPPKPTKPTKPPKPRLPRQPGKKPSGPRIILEEVDFTDEAQPDKLHSRFLSGKVQVNKLNPDFQREMDGSDAEKLAYGTLMIGKETIAYNDDSKASNEYLEKLLTFLFQAKVHVGRAATTGLRARGRPRKVLA
ncbi:MAG: ATP-binding protein [Chloroflexota bacterium]|nr:ATP-binding protein [Chloroflexota bacterium]